MTTENETPVPAAAHGFFRTTQERAEKGSAPAMIKAELDVRQAKTQRLRAARHLKEEADAKVEAEAKAAMPEKKKRKPAVKKAV